MTLPAIGDNHMGIPALLQAIRAVAVVILSLGVSVNGNVAVVETKAKRTPLDSRAAKTESDWDMDGMDVSAIGGNNCIALNVVASMTLHYYYCAK